MKLTNKMEILFLNAAGGKHLIWGALLIVVFALLILLIQRIFFYRKAKLLIRANKELQSFKELYETFHDADTNYIYLKDKGLNYVFVNKALRDFYGCTAEEIIGHDDFSLLEPEFAKMCTKSDKTSLEKNEPITSITSWKGRFFKITKFPVRMIDKTIGVGAYISDVTDEYKRQQEMEYISFHDSLTGLYNRRFFEEELCRVDTVRNQPITILMGDANSLKLTNDIFGHTYGDILLKKIANVMKKVCRADDILARWGGDEFVLLLPGTDAKEAGKIVERIEKELAEQRVCAVRCSISLGYATKTELSEDITQILSQAEMKMYTVKSLRRDEMLNGELTMLVHALFEKSDWERKHALRMQDLCQRFGKELSLPESDINKLRHAGYLHDIGMIAMEPEILKNDGEIIDSAVISDMKMHVVVGYRILSSFDSTVELAETVLAHHENWDGSGYPKSLKGEQIPLLARILGIVEAYEHLISSGDDKNKNEAIKKIQSWAGTKFDPEITDVFVKMIKENKSGR